MIHANSITALLKTFINSPSGKCKDCSNSEAESNVNALKNKVTHVNRLQKNVCCSGSIPSVKICGATNRFSCVNICRNKFPLNAFVLALITLGVCFQPAQKPSNKI